MDEPEIIECYYCYKLHLKQCLIKCHLCLEMVCLDCKGKKEKYLCSECEYICECINKKIM